MDHTAYQKQCKTMSIESLWYVMDDCREAIKINPTGDNVGYYQDEIHYCAMELMRRKKNVGI